MDRWLPDEIVEQFIKKWNAAVLDRFHITSTDPRGHR